MHGLNAAAVEAMNDYRTGIYTTDDAPNAFVVLAFVESKPRLIGRIDVDAGDAGGKRKVDFFAAQCFANYCDRNGIGGRNVVRIAAASEYAYPTQFECPWCGTIRLGYDINRTDTMSVGKCSHYVVWVTRPDYDRARGMKHLGQHLTYQRRPVTEAA